MRSDEMRLVLETVTINDFVLRQPAPAQAPRIGFHVVTCAHRSRQDFVVCDCTIVWSCDQLLYCDVLVRVDALVCYCVMLCGRRRRRRRCR